MRIIKYLLIISLLASIYSCEELDDFLGENSDGLSESEVVEGLKTALQAYQGVTHGPKYDKS